MQFTQYLRTEHFADVIYWRNRCGCIVSRTSFSSSLTPAISEAEIISAHKKQINAHLFPSSTAENQWSSFANWDRHLRQNAETNFDIASKVTQHTATGNSDSSARGSARTWFRARPSSQCAALQWLACTVILRQTVTLVLHSTCPALNATALSRWSLSESFRIKVPVAPARSWGAWNVTWR